MSSKTKWATYICGQNTYFERRVYFEHGNQTKWATYIRVQGDKFERNMLIWIYFL